MADRDLHVDAMPAPRSGSAGAAMLSRAARLARRSGAALMLALVFAVSLELTARLQDWVRYRTPILSPVADEGDLMMRDRLGAHGRPDARYGRWVMDSLGLRGPDVPVAKPPSTVRVVVLGASETFGLYESPHQEYARQLEDTLRARLAAGACGDAAPRRVEVLNAALPGMSLPTVTQDVRTRLGRLDPDVMVYYPSPAQYLDTRPPTATPPDSSRRSHALPRTRILHFRSLNALRDALKSLLPGPVVTWLRQRDVQRARRGRPAAWRFSTVPRTRLALYEADLRKLIGAIRADGAQPVIATHATAFEHHRADSAALVLAWDRFYPRATGNTIIAFDSTARASSRRVALDSGAVLADVAAAFARDTGRDFADFVHFTDAGAAIVAHIMAPAVLEAARRRGECGR